MAMSGPIWLGAEQGKQAPQLSRRLEGLTMGLKERRMESGWRENERGGREKDGRAVEELRRGVGSTEGDREEE